MAPSAADPSSTKVAAATVEKAVSSLLKWKEAQSETQKPKLIPEDDFIYLILTLKKIPANPRTNAFKIPLPHPLHASSEICLIVDDRTSSNTISESFKQIIRAQNIPISKVIKLSKLKANYKPFEARRKLCNSYDLFLVDKRIVHFMPRLLGKSFFTKKKLPIPVDMTKKNWKDQVSKACGAGLLYLRTGTCSVMKVGKTAMEKEQVVENVVEGIEGVVNIVPKKWGGVRSLHLKLADSVALPLYQALPDVKLRIEGVREAGEKSESEVEFESGKEDTLLSEKNKGGRKKKDKGRIHEVLYMDDGLAEDQCGSEDADDDKEHADEGKEKLREKSNGDEMTGKKRKMGGLEDEGNVNDSEECEDSENGDVGVKKGKKGKGVKQVVLSKEDVEQLRAKKGRIVGKTEGGKPKKVGDESLGKKGKRKSELVVKPKEGSAQAKDKKSKKKVSA